VSLKKWARNTRNIALAVLGTLWLVPFSVCVAHTLAFLRVLEKSSLDKANPDGWSFSHMDMARSAFVYATILFGVACFTYTILLANRLLGKNREEAH
jgi:hypothetical protein